MKGPTVIECLILFTLLGIISVIFFDLYMSTETHHRIESISCTPL